MLFIASRSVRVVTCQSRCTASVNEALSTASDPLRAGLRPVEALGRYAVDFNHGPLACQPRQGLGGTQPHISKAKAPQPDRDVRFGVPNSGLPHIIVRAGQNIGVRE